MDITLIDPAGVTKGLNAGLAYLAGSLIQHGYGVRVIDLNNRHNDFEKRIEQIDSDIVGVSLKSAIVSGAKQIFNSLNKGRAGFGSFCAEGATCAFEAAVIEAVQRSRFPLYGGRLADLPKVKEYIEFCKEAYDEVAAAMGVTGAAAAIDAVRKLTAGINMPQKLSDVGVKEKDLEEIAELSLGDGSMVTNARPVEDAADMLEILKKAF